MSVRPYQSYMRYTKWILICDVDEYVFSTMDQSQFFLSRYISKVEHLKPDKNRTRWLGPGSMMAMASDKSIVFVVLIYFHLFVLIYVVFATIVGSILPFSVVVFFICLFLLSFFFIIIICFNARSS